MRRRTRITLGAAALVLAAGGALVFAMVRRGFSALDEPSAVEALLARTMRRLSAPPDLRGRGNPLPASPQVLVEGREHFADHCATCHGNDGKGQTDFGQNMYPRAPDMTGDETQSQSDGELFATIENGVRLSGMPGFGGGSAESARGSWALVHFIRHLPKLTEEERSEMERLNPKTLAEWNAIREEQEFLAGEQEAGGDAAPATPKAHHH
jgi:mono/diheme cytochrome c family protein